MGTKPEKIAVFYTHFSKSKNAQKNYDYFIKNGIDTAGDIYLGTSRCVQRYAQDQIIPT